MDLYYQCRQRGTKFRFKSKLARYQGATFGSCSFRRTCWLWGPNRRELLRGQTWIQSTWDSFKLSRRLHQHWSSKDNVLRRIPLSAKRHDPLRRREQERLSVWVDNLAALRWINNGCNCCPHSKRKKCSADIFQCKPRAEFVHGRNATVPVEYD